MPSAPGVGARGRVPHLQRGILSHRRRRLDAPGALRGSAAARTDPGRVDTADPEVHGLVALMEIQASRLRARVGAGGRADPAARSGPRPLGPAADPPRPGRARPGRTSWQRHAGAYTLQAAIAAVPRAGPLGRGDGLAADRRALRDARARRASPVVELNRAVAVAMAYGPAAALRMVDALADEPTLRGYHLLPSVRGDLLARLGRGSTRPASSSRGRPR